MTESVGLPTGGAHVGVSTVRFARRLAILAAVLWSVLVAVLIGMALQEERVQTESFVHIRAQTHLNKDLAYRLWATSHGGVYVPATDETPPSPWLAHLPERDVHTPSGVHLTLLNPAYVQRQVMAQYEANYGVKGHITSLEPLNPGNAPDEWEEDALRAMEQGVAEVSAIVELGGEPQYRLMRPLMVESKCLKCHGHQGYLEGEVRGGVSVSVPMGQLLAEQSSAMRTHALSLGSVWLLGMLGLAFGHRQVRRRIEAQVETESALAQANERLNATLDALPDLLFEVADDGRVIDYRSQSPDQLQPSPERFLGRSFTETLPAAAAEPVGRAIQEALAAGRPSRASFSLETPETRWYDVSIAPIRGLPGREARCVALVRDITAMQRTQRELEQLAMAIEQSSEAVLITDALGTTTYVNPAYERVTGWTAGEVLGRREHLLDSGEHDRTFYNELWQLIRSGNTWRGRIQSRRKDGTRYTEETSISPVRGPGGAITSYVAVKRDVSQMLRLEEQLRGAQKMEALGTLAGGIAHDFNNILGAVVGFTELSRAAVDPGGEVDENLQYVLQAAQRARELVREILTFSRPIEGRRVSVDVSALAREALLLVKATFPATIRVEAECDAEGMNVLGDPSRLHQVLLNLCTNAMQAMRRTGGVLQVRVARCVAPAIDVPPSLPPGDYVLVLVADDGPGIDPAVMPRIFDPYFSTKAPGEGTGLGLAVVHGIVQGHGGAVTVRSTPGQGAAFSVYLPLCVGAPRAIEADTLPVPCGGERILFVDDEEMLTRIGTAYLERLGYKVTATNSPLSAWDLFAASPDAFDLIVTDQTMPNMTGLELMRRVRAMRSELPVIICSGYSEALEKVGMALPDLGGAPEGGVPPDGAASTQLLTKPIDLDTIARAVRRALDLPPA